MGADRRAARASGGRAAPVAIAPICSSTSPAHWQRAADLERYEASLLEALAADPVHPEAYQLLADHLNGKRDYATLVGIAEQAVEGAPLSDQPRRLAELADLYEKKLGDVGHGGRCAGAAPRR